MYARLSRVFPESPRMIFYMYGEKECICTVKRHRVYVAITVTTTALDRVSGVVCGDACVPGFGCGLARLSRWVEGLVLRLVCEVLLSVSCARSSPVSLMKEV